MQKDLITKHGYEKIVEEFKRLLKEKSYWVKEKEIAAQLGDRSENAEYIAAKEQIRNTDKRLRFLDKIINNSEVIDISLIPHIKVNFGSEVVIKDLDTNENKTFIPVLVPVFHEPVVSPEIIIVLYSHVFAELIV